MNEDKFIERRKQYRLPYGERVIFTDGKVSLTSYGSNVSRGGLFVTTLNPFPINTIGYIAFFLPNYSSSFCVKGKVAHIVFDKKRCEVECGMGFQFIDMSENQISLINLHIMNQQNAYLELQTILKESNPNSSKIDAVVKKIPTLNQYTDLLSLRYRVDRICTMFEAYPDEFEEVNQAFKIA
jgi:Tfp pilus assembly protein PilZ